MRKLSIAIILTLTLIGQAGAVPIYSPVTEHLYERIDSNDTWEVAKFKAEQMIYNGIPGHLATITSEAENQWIVNNLGEASVLDHWLGGFRYDNDTEWQWITGELWSYANWFPGEPNAPRGEYVGLEFDDSETTPPVLGYWNDIGVQSHENGFVVEWDTKPVPEPSTILLFGSGLIGLVGWGRKKFRK